MMFMHIVTLMVMVMVILMNTDTLMGMDTLIAMMTMIIVTVLDILEETLNHPQKSHLNITNLQLRTLTYLFLLNLGPPHHLITTKNMNTLTQVILNISTIAITPIRQSPLNIKATSHKILTATMMLMPRIWTVELLFHKTNHWFQITTLKSKITKVKLLTSTLNH